jgi:hypothetical protein
MRHEQAQENDVVNDLVEPFVGTGEKFCESGTSHHKNHECLEGVDEISPEKGFRCPREGGARKVGT